MSKAFIDYLKNIEPKLDKCIEMLGDLSETEETIRQYSASSMNLGNIVNNGNGQISNDVLTNTELGLVSLEAATQCSLDTLLNTELSLSSLETSTQCSEDTLLNVELLMACLEGQATILENQKLILEKLSKLEK